MQSLNMAAHASAQAHGDEFVKEALLSHGNLDSLALNLLTFEVRRRSCGALLLPQAQGWEIRGRVTVDRCDEGSRFQM